MPLFGDTLYRIIYHFTQAGDTALAFCVPEVSGLHRSPSSIFELFSSHLAASASITFSFLFLKFSEAKAIVQAKARSLIQQAGLAHPDPQ